jgi:endonuclease/exonuclease/phosphatase family metal-dependent hydrolase
MRSIHLATGLLLAAPLAACSPGSPSEREASSRVAEAEVASSGHGGVDRGRRGGDVTVMTRNLYLGGDIGRIAATTSPEEIPAAAGALWAAIQASDFPSRARLVADEIDEARPDLVALEEVSLFRTGPPLSCAGLVSPATDVAIDFLAILEAELAARGLDYRVASSVENFDAQLCTALDASHFLDVRLTDRDAILVHGRLETASPRSGHFEARALFPAAGGFLPVVRGWNTVEVKSRRGWFRFAMAHLETEAFPDVQAAQGRELAAIAGAGREPVILAGDFNAGPELAAVTTTYADLLGAGFRDPWPHLHPRDPGQTCCFDELLLTGTLTQRIDLTLTQGKVKAEASRRTGLRSRTPAGQHPSDHAGVVTRFRIGDDDRGPRRRDRD